MGLSFVHRKEELLGELGEFHALNGPRLARRSFSFLIGGPGAQASWCLLMSFQRPPDLTAGLLGKV